MAASTAAAHPVNFVRMGQNFKAMVPRHFFLLFLDIRILKFSNPPALKTDEVIVMVTSYPALVQPVSPVKIVDLQDIVPGQKP